MAEYHGTPIEDQPHQQGHTIWPRTLEVKSDEPALLLIERDEMRPDNTGWNRYQTIFVWRGNGLAKFMTDMGPSELTLAGPLDIPGGDPAIPDTEWLETVDSLRDYALECRELLTIRTMNREVPNLIGGFNDWVDEENLRRNHTSVSGSMHKVER